MGSDDIDKNLSLAVLTDSDEYAYWLRRAKHRNRRESVRQYQALMLAKTPEAWAALLMGHTVPVDQLDVTYLSEYRRRRK